jgi:protein SCO1/2
MIPPGMSTFQWQRFAFVLAAGFALALPNLSCQRNSPAAAGAHGTNQQVYQVKGVIQELMPDKKKVKIAHENIPNYMEAMTMVFDVKDPAGLTGLQPGDSVSFRMVVTDDDGWIEQIKRLDAPRTPLPAEPVNFRRAREVEPLAVGDKLPEYVFTNTLGRALRLSEFKGQALALTFIFTRCPFPTFCPRLTSNFAEAQKQLLAMSGGPTNWHLLSVTIDPEYDTPARLRSYAERYHADERHWDIVTGELIDITAIGEQFGLQFWRAKPSDPINHNVRTVVIDSAGTVQWITPDNEWKPEVLVEQILKGCRRAEESGQK